MPIRKVQFVPGEFYHIYNRGNAKQNIFYNDRDRYRFLQAMYISNNSNSFVNVEDLAWNKDYTLVAIKEIFEKNKVPYDPLVRICADCLMPNHFHFIIQEIKQGGITRFMQRLGNGYGKYISLKYERPGSLFQGRFKAVHVKNNDQLKYLLVYVNAINPAQLVEPELKENGIVNFKKVWEKVENYSWSTHFEFVGKRESILIDKGLLGQMFLDKDSYCDFVRDILISKERKLWNVLGDLSID